MIIIKDGIKDRSKTGFLVHAQNLTKVYGKGNLAFKALNNINLKIKRGNFISVVGPSGSGKTTLLNMLGALDKPTSGEVTLDNIEISKVEESKLYRIRREKVGFVFQSYYLIPTLNALQNILIPTYPVQNKEKNYVLRAKELLDKVGLRNKEHRKPAQLSGGEQQRVAIARSLILDPILILADEPTGNLDTKTGAEIIKLLRGLNQAEKKTLLVVTHDQRITQFCDRVITLQDGQIS